MKKRPLCLLCIGLMLAIWALKLAGAPLLGEPALPAELSGRLQEGMTLSITGTILGRTEKSDTIQYILTDTSLTYQEEQIPLKKILLSLQKQENQEVFRIGDRLNALGKLKALQAPGNPGEFDRKAYYACKGIYYSMWGNKLTLLHRPESSLAEVLQGFRQKVTDRLQTLTPANIGGILAVMTWGEKEDLEEESRQLYQISGLSHILSISGLHISLLGMTLFRLLLRLGLVDKMAAPLSASLMGLYCFLVGGQPSALRSCIMFGVMLGARLLGRSYDLLSALALAGILILLENPAYLFFSGFQLSFAAVLGVGIFYPLLTALMPKKLRKSRKRSKVSKGDKGEKGRLLNLHRMMWRLLAGLWQAGASWLAVNILLLPLIAYYFYEIPVYSLFVNLLLVPLAEIVLVFGIAGSLTALPSPGLGKLILQPALLCLQVFRLVTSQTARLPRAVWICGQPSLLQVFLYYLGLGAFLFLLHKKVEEDKRKEWRKDQGKDGRKDLRGRGRIRPVGLLGLAVGSCLVLFFHPSPGVTITALDVGQGDCLAVSSGSIVYLVDGGSSDVNQVGTYRILPYLKQQGIGCLEGIFLTHPDQDHSNGIQELLEALAAGETSLEVKRLLLPWWMEDLEESKPLQELAREAGLSLNYLQGGDFMRAHNLQIRVLYPFAASSARGNEGSLVLELTSGSFRGLLTGDLEGVGEEELQASSLLTECAYLKVAHHGSRNSTSAAFLEKVQPKVCIISAPRNSIYGHPHAQVLERIEDRGAAWYQTGISGAIRVKLQKGNMQVEEYRYRTGGLFTGW